MKFFWEDLPLNADIERHRSKERELQEQVSALEALEERDAFQERCLGAYKHFLCQLLQSKADTVSKLGKKKK